VNAGIATLVVDDEPLARRRLLHLLRQVPDITVVGTFGSASEAAAQALEAPPQLLLLDIRMPELDGFELVSTLATKGLNPYIIFVTAHSDRSLDAFEVGAIDYLLKPFDDERFARAIERALTLIASGPRSKTPAAAQPPSLASGRTRLLLAEHGKVVVLAMRDIEFVQAAAKHVKIYAGGRCYSFRQSLRELESRLDASCFVRVHRSALVNVEYIAEMHPMFHGDYELILKRGTRLTLSRRYRERLAPFLLE
jgi:two-component system, LytTR family, response regulator